MTYDERNEQLLLLSDEALLETLFGCEEAVAKGTAQIDDYQRFVVCAEEVTKRYRLHHELCAWAKSLKPFQRRVKPKMQ